MQAGTDEVLEFRIHGIGNYFGLELAWQRP